MKLAFAKDITPTRCNQKSPSYFEEHILRYATLTKRTYKGFILPWNGRLTRVLLEDTQGRTITPYAKNVLSSLTRLNFDTPDKYRCRPEYKETNKKFFTDILKKCGYTFLGYKGEQQISFYCPYHDKETTRYTYDVKKQGFAYCDDCLSVMRAGNIGFYNNLKGYKCAPVSIYVQSLGDKFGKYGTSKNPELRLEQQSRHSIFEHKLLFTYEFKDGWKAIDLEEGLRQNFKGKKARKKDMPDGHTETFSARMMDDVLEFIRNYIELDPAKPMYLNSDYDFWSKIGEGYEITDEEIECDLGMMFNQSDESDYEELDLSPLEAL
ncbi:TPA: hypothetical protein ACGWHI_003461 [Salmonella enterica]